MHHRSASWVKGHYRNGTWIAGHNRKSTYVSDYTKNSYFGYAPSSSINTALGFQAFRKKEKVILNKINMSEAETKQMTIFYVFKLIGFDRDLIAFGKKEEIAIKNRIDFSEYNGVSAEKIYQIECTNDNIKILYEQVHKLYSYCPDKPFLPGFAYSITLSEHLASIKLLAETVCFTTEQRGQKIKRDDLAKNDTARQKYSSNISFYLYRINRRTKSDIIAYGTKFIDINDFNEDVLSVEMIDKIEAKQADVLLLENIISKRYGSNPLDASISEIQGTYLSSLNGIKILVEESLFTAEQRLEKEILQKKIIEAQKVQEEKEFPLYLYRLSKPRKINAFGYGTTMASGDVLGYGTTLVSRDNYKGTWMRVKKIYEIRGFKKDILEFEQKISNNYDKVPSGILELGVRGTSFSQLDAIMKLARNTFQDIR